MFHFFSTFFHILKETSKQLLLPRTSKQLDLGSTLSPTRTNDLMTVIASILKRENVLYVKQIFEKY